MTNTIGHGVTQTLRKPVDMSAEGWQLLNKMIAVLSIPGSDLLESKLFTKDEIAKLNTPAKRQQQLSKLIKLRQDLADEPNM